MTKLLSFRIDLNKKYGLMLSGGLDSAILLGYLLQVNSKINIQCFTIPKHDGAALYANNIISFFNNRFKTEIKNTEFVGDPDVFHRLQSTIAVKEIFEKFEIDILLNALNRIPEELNSPSAPLRNKKSDHPKILLPFVDYLKTDIIQLAFDIGLEELFRITHSCTEEKLTRCNQCWQCKERAWAFSKLNKIDTGKV